MAVVLVYDILFGKGISNSTKHYQSLLKRHQTRLNAELVKIKISRKCIKNEELIPEHIREMIVLPRYIRVNTLLTTPNEVAAHFQSMGFQQGDNDTLAISPFPYLFYVKFILL